MREFGFTAPGYSKNFSQNIDIKGKDDLAYVARMAFRVLRDVYDVRDFSAARFKLTLAKPSRPIPELGFGAHSNTCRADGGNSIRGLCRR